VDGETISFSYKPFFDESADFLKLIQLEDLIHSMIIEKAEYKELPEANGAYERLPSEYRGTDPLTVNKEDTKTRFQSQCLLCCFYEIITNFSNKKRIWQLVSRILPYTIRMLVM
jgi:hypothetical protein